MGSKPTGAFLAAVAYGALHEALRADRLVAVDALEGGVSA